MKAARTARVGLLINIDAKPAVARKNETKAEEKRNGNKEEEYRKIL